MINGLFQATYQQVWTLEHMTKLKMILAKVKIMDEYLLSSRMGFMQRKVEKMDLTPYETCFKLENKLNDACSLVLTLAVLLDKFGFHKAQEHIVTYGASSMVNPDTANLSDYMSEIFNIDITDIKLTNSSSLASKYGVLILYQTFFEVLNKNNSNLLEPQPLSSYFRKMTTLVVPDQSKLGHYLSWVLSSYSNENYHRKIDLNQYSAIQELSDFVAVTWLDALKLYLGVRSHEEATLLMNSFWHTDNSSSLFQPLKERRENGYMCSNLLSNASLYSIKAVCNGPQKIEMECKNYCKLIDNLSAETQTRIKEVFKMGLDDPTPPIGTFQICQHPTKGFFGTNECWKRIVNDKGVCYTSKGNGEGILYFGIHFFVTAIFLSQAYSQTLYLGL